MSRHGWRLLATAALVAALTGCSGGEDCGGLAALTVERDQARAGYLELARGQQAGSGVTAEQVELEDDRLHDLERRHTALTEACDR
ncbi:MAG: hypothetical protein JWN08_1928 [Frankiales bacterium]|nr:hypothetical protein [Frankiales bacterium]